MVLSPIKKIFFHPIVFALFPLVSLLITNREKLDINDISGTIILVLLISSGVWVILDTLIKDRPKSAIITSVFLILFFAYGHVVNITTALLFLANVKNTGKYLFVSKYSMLILLSLWIFIFFVFLYLMIKTKSNVFIVNGFLNVVAIAIIFSFLGTWINRRFKNQDESQNFRSYWKVKSNDEFRSPNTLSGESLPDIYYIILDSYGRNDILNEIYHYDNSGFLSYLEDHGFYVAKESHSNYSQTILSITSSLNFMYLDDLPDQLGVTSQDIAPVRTMFEDNRLITRLKSKDYLIREITTGYYLAENPNSDLSVVPDWHVNTFQNEMIDLTPFQLLLRLPFLKSQFDVHGERILYALDHLAYKEEGNQPVFTFAHILSPHPPFVFDANGQPIESWRPFSILLGEQNVSTMGRDEYIQGYRGQITYLTKIVQVKIQELLSNSERPTVIILQSDHGPSSKLDYQDIEGSYFPERLSILNAYYFSDQNYAQLYPGITPVNTFRVILDQYFGEELELLEDTSYFSSPGSPYFLIDVTQDIN